MRHTKFLVPVLVLAAGAILLRADTVSLRNGKRLEGTFVGGGPNQVEFQTSDGVIKIPIDNVATIKFSAPPPVEAAPPASGQAAIVPGGTSFRVRTIDAIDVDATKAGAKFRGTIDDPIMSGGNVIVPRGAPVTLLAAKVEQGGRMKGSDLIQLKVNAISVGGKSYQVVTTMAEQKTGGEGKKTAGKVLGGAGLGAIIGGIAGGGKGAAIGAVAGGATGTAIAAAGQPHLKIPSETRLEFQLLADWKIQ
ncbi:MAG TPA: hypothetical protein VMJ75_04720 [Candidatus Acidoferrales bacterium]|nr:hypothetical protein [Candidatus Acidoferrales bacterium]